MDVFASNDFLCQYGMCSSESGSPKLSPVMTACRSVREYNYRIDQASSFYSVIIFLLAPFKRKKKNTSTCGADYFPCPSNSHAGMSACQPKCQLIPKTVSFYTDTYPLNMDPGYYKLLI